MANAAVGGLRIFLGANTAAYEAGMKRAAVTARTTAASIQKSFAGIKANLSATTFGLVGGALGASIIGLGKRALEYASSLGEVSQQLGVTTEALQVYRFAASQVGVTQDEMDTSLKKLSDSIAEAGQGSKAQATAFNELGVNVKTANGELKSTDRILREMADGFAKLKNPADQVRLGIDLMGRSGSKLVPLLSGGSKAVDELTEAARKLGVVLSDEQIQNADRTADKLAELKAVLEARIAGVVADNSGAIENLASSLYDLAGAAVEAAAEYSTFLKTIGGGSVGRGAFITGIPGLGVSGIPFAIRDMLTRSGEVGVGGGFGTSVSGTLGTPKPFVAPSATGLNRIAGGGGRKGPRGKTAEQLAEEAARQRIDALNRAFDLDEQINRAKVEELNAQQNLTDDYVERQDISHQIIDLEAEQRNKQLDHNLKIAKLEGTYDQQFQNTTDELKLSNEKLRILKKQEVNLQVELDRQRDFNRLEDLDLNLQRDQLQAQADLAETQAERRRLELQMLDVAYRQWQLDIDRLRASKDFADQEEGRRQQLALNARRPLDTAGVIAGTRGPLEDFQAQLPTTADKMNEALQSVAVDGLQALEDGILSVIDGTKSLGEAFRDMASQIIADLLRIQIQRAIIGPIANALGGILGVGAAVGTGGFATAGMGDVANFVRGLASGGFTGYMPANKVAGFVHGQEYVFDAEATRRIGVGNLEAMRRGLPIPNNDNPFYARNSTFNINVTAPNTGDPKRDRQNAFQQAVMARNEIAKVSRQGG